MSEPWVPTLYLSDKADQPCPDCARLRSELAAEHDARLNQEKATKLAYDAWDAAVLRAEAAEQKLAAAREELEKTRRELARLRRFETADERTTHVLRTQSEALQNMSGAFDTPVARRRGHYDAFQQEAIDSMRAALAPTAPEPEQGGRGLCPKCGEGMNNLGFTRNPREVLMGESDKPEEHECFLFAHHRKPAETSTDRPSCGCQDHDNGCARQLPKPADEKGGGE